MRNLKYFCAAAAIGGLMALPQTGSASPLAPGLGGGNMALPELSEGLIQKVHGWHCGKRRGWYHGHRVWHRHYRACHYRKRYYNDYYNDDYDDDYYPYAYSYPYYYPGPFLSFSFGGHRRHHWDWDD